MPRRERRLGVSYITNDKERDVTFFKRRFGLFKGATDLSVVTGARVAVILETDRGKIHSFGTPSAKPIVDAFLSGAPPAAPFLDEAKASKIALLQSKVAQLDMKSAMEDKRNKLSIQRMKEIQDENPGMEANLIFSKEEDLCLEDLNKLFNELSRAHEDITSRLPPLHHGLDAKNGGLSMKRNMLPPREPKLNAIRQNSDYPKMTSSEVLSEIIAMDISKNNADVLVALPHNAHKNNLFLKSKVSEESESDEDPMDWVPEDIK
ncbi:MADS-box protein AGL71-like [Lolium rigidum]|uniref:MADS-box protein AGL71-like n=1 Tax=Lolium rigidum TaxID=89674 RepID=UPI001F5C6383|nr:MADS-box protein AGL71-like [Lolium rigidum]